MNNQVFVGLIISLHLVFLSSQQCIPEIEQNFEIIAKSARSTVEATLGSQSILECNGVAPNRGLSSFWTFNGISLCGMSSPTKYKTDGKYKCEKNITELPTTDLQPCNSQSFSVKLIIPNFQRSDEGNYTCVLLNSATSTQEKIELKLKPPLDDTTNALMIILVCVAAFIFLVSMFVMSICFYKVWRKKHSGI